MRGKGFNVVCLVLLALAAGQSALAGLVISSDNSDLCNSNMKDCNQRCPPPQNFLFMCSSGGTFSKPQSDCKCITPPPVGVVTDGSATWQMVQWPGAEPCQGNTWLYDCAQYLNLNAMANNLNGQATDQASAMAAVAAAKAAAEAQAAQAAQMAAMAAQQQQQQQAAGQSGGDQAGSPSSMAPAPPSVPGMDAGGVPGMGGAGAGGGMGAAAGGGDSTMGGGAGAGGQPMGPAGGAGMGGMGGGMGGQNAGMMGGGGGGGGAGMMGQGGGAGGAMPGASLMGTNGMMGHRHLMQFGAGAPLGGGSGAAAGGGGLGAGTGGALPSTQLGPACQKPITGVVTGANTGVLVIPNFKGVASMMTRGNDTMFIQLGGQGTQCVAGYKLMGGKIMDVGRSKEEVQKQQEAAAKKSSAAATAGAPAWGIAMLLGGVLLVLL